MKVDSVKQNYQVGHDSARYKGVHSSVNSGVAAPSFTGSSLTQDQKLFLSLFPKFEAILYKAISKIKDYSKGEVGGILINAIGTGAVAPWFIAYNPFVKANPDATEAEKEEISKTKKYTAMRQPVSAALAILIQVGVQKPIDKILQKITNDKDVAKYFKGWVLNQTSLNDDAYMERMIKKEIKNGTISQGYKMVDGKPVPEEIKDTVARIKGIRQGEQIKNIVDSLKKDGTISMGDYKINNSAVAEVLNNRIDDYIQFAKEQKIDDPHFKKYMRRSAELVENKEYLNRILNPEVLGKLPDQLSDGRINPKELKIYLASQLPTAPNDAVKGIIREIIADYDFTRESLCARTLERIDKIENACGGVYSPDSYREYLQKFNDTFDGKIKDLEALKIKDLKTVNAETIKETIPKIVEACHFDGEDTTLKCIFKDSGIFKPKTDTTLSSRVYNDVVKSYKEFAGHKFGIFKQLSKVAVGVAITLPITCYALNWVYPRFMDIFFPSLGKSNTEAKTEETKGGNE